MVEGTRTGSAEEVLALHGCGRTRRRRGPGGAWRCRPTWTGLSRLRGSATGVGCGRAALVGGGAREVGCGEARGGEDLAEEGGLAEVEALRMLEDPQELEQFVGHGVGPASRAEGVEGGGGAAAGALHAVAEPGGEDAQTGDAVRPGGGGDGGEPAVAEAELGGGGVVGEGLWVVSRGDGGEAAGEAVER